MARVVRPFTAFGFATWLGAYTWPWLQAPPATSLAAAAVLAALSAVRVALGPWALGASGLVLGWGLVGGLPDPPRLEGAWRLRGTVVSDAGACDDLALVTGTPRGGVERQLRGRIRVCAGDLPATGREVLVEGDAGPVRTDRLPGEPDPVAEAARSAVASVLVARDVVVVGRPARAPVIGQRAHAGLLRSLANGDTRELSADEVGILRGTGTWHLVSVSGLHIGLAASLAWGLCWLATRPLAWRWPGGGLRWICAAGAVGAACAYATWAGWPVPARRAVWMTAAGAACVVAGRRPHPGDVLGLAAVATLAVEPTSAGSMGFLLSFGAMLGMACAAPRVLRWLPPDSRWPLRWFAEAVAASVGATLGTLPVLAWRFQDLSPLTLPANLWAVPWIGGVATPSVLLAQLLPGGLADVALTLGDWACEVGLWGLSAMTVENWHPAAGGWAVVAVALAPVLARWEALAATCLLLGLGLTGTPAGHLVVTFLSVGQGDAALVEWPGGRRWLIDAGPPGSSLVRALRRMGVRRLDAAIVSHPHPDHEGGLAAVAAGMPVGASWTRPEEGLAPGQIGPPGWFVAPSVNDSSRILMLRYGSRRFLFPGDAEAAEEVASLGADLRADVLKVGHHGSRTSSSVPFLDAVSPSIAVISAGQGNRYGHPHAEAFSRLRGVRVYRTDRDGNVEVRTDGESLEVRLVDPPEPWRLRDCRP
jgi:competence protein ComEC